MKKVAWFSCGATSTITCYLALQEDKDTEIVYIETGSHHPDSLRFIKDCENKLFHKKITILQSRYKDIFDVFDRMAKLERKLNAHALKECFLDELKEDRGSINEIMPQCNIFCGMI